MSRPNEWIAILAGVLLLGGSALLDRGFEWATRRAQELASEVDGTDLARREAIVIKLLEGNPRLGRTTSQRIADAVLRCDREQQLAPDLVLRVMFAESSARPEARSPKGAIGLMQVMPYMFEELDLPGNVAHIEANVEAGCILLADNIRRMGEDDGISAYYWGGKIQGDGYLRRVRSMLPDLDLAPPVASSQ
jgi:soluble lytic murein transglycosylase-like protein